MVRHDIRQLLLACLLLLTASWARAEDALMKSFAIDVVLHADGSARITEVWNVDVNTDRFSEFYNSYYNHYFGRITDVSVSDGATMLTTDAYWDPGATVDEKVGHCGLVATDDGDFQICWGVGQPGHHRYMLRYTATAVVHPYSDSLVLMNVPLLITSTVLPCQAASATITRGDSAFTSDDIVSLEVKGAARGGFSNGRIEVQSTRTMSEGDHMIVQILFRASAFGELSTTGLSTEIGADELSSPMMRDSQPGRYEQSWWGKVLDFYDEWPIATLMCILAALLGLFYLVKKLVIALL